MHDRILLNERMRIMLTYIFIIAWVMIIFFVMGYAIKRVGFSELGEAFYAFGVALAIMKLYLILRIFMLRSILKSKK